MPGSRFAHPKAAGEHKVHDTQIKRFRHLNFFQHECYLELRVPQVELPDGKVALVEPDWVGELAGFTLLFEALVLMLASTCPRPSRIATCYDKLARNFFSSGALSPPWSTGCEL